MGKSLAKRLIFFAERLKAEEAQSLNVIDFVADSNEGMYTMLDSLLARLLKNGPVAIRAAKKAIDGGVGKDIDGGLAVEEDCYGMVLRTQDRIEGIKAFLEKRSPNYQNK